MISSQDFERLSAYLDGQLSPNEKAALEARLAREPELKTALGDLRQTVYALRSLPKVRPPRNFTLSAKQAQRLAPQRRLFPAFRLATSLAALTMVLAFAGDFVASRVPVMSPAAPMRSTVVEQQNAAAPPAATAPPVLAQAIPAPTQPLDKSPVGAGAATGAAGESLPATPIPEVGTPMAAAVLAASPAAADNTTTSAPAAEQATAAATEPVAAKAAPNQPMPASVAPTDTAALPAALPAATAEPAGEARQAVTEVPAVPAPAETAPLPEPAVEAKAVDTEAAAPVAPAESAAPPAAEAYLAATPTVAAAPAAVPVPITPSVPAVPWRAVEAGLIALTLVLAALTWFMRRR